LPSGFENNFTNRIRRFDSSFYDRIFKKVEDDTEIKYKAKLKIKTKADMAPIGSPKGRKPVKLPHASPMMANNNQKKKTPLKVRIPIETNL
jgi:hypothetical protein